SIDAALLELAQHRGLQAREREVQRTVSRAADREREAVSAATRRDPVHDGSAGIAEARPAGDLVEGLSGRVIARAGQRHDPLGLDAHELRVTARYDEPVKRLGDRKRPLAARPQERGEEM